jgi:hypothetical protein
MSEQTNHHFPTDKKFNPMKTFSKLTAVALLILAGVANVRAAHTNIVQTLNFKLTAWSQGPTTTNGSIVSVQANPQSILTKDIVGWLGAATTNSFVNGQLLVINELGVPAAKTYIVVRTKTTITKTTAITNDVDVSDFFASVTYAATVNSYSYNTANNAVGPGIYRGYWGFYLLNEANHPALPVTFQVTGLGVDSAVNIVGKKKVVYGLADQFSISNAAGTGLVNGLPFIIGGNIVIIGKTLEVAP